MAILMNLLLQSGLFSAVVVMRGLPTWISDFWAFYVLKIVKLWYFIFKVAVFSVLVTKSEFLCIIYD